MVFSLRYAGRKNKYFLLSGSTADLPSILCIRINASLSCVSYGFIPASYVVLSFLAEASSILNIYISFDWYGYRFLIEHDFLCSVQGARKMLCNIPVRGYMK
jgi:hypothetical protein